MKNIIILLFVLFSTLVYGQADRTIDTSVVEYKDILTPSNPDAGKFKVYAKSGSLYILNSAGTETAIGSGAGGGVSQWLTGQNYTIDDLVIESNKFYICIADHLSGTFATDLAALSWQLITTEGIAVVNVPAGNIAATTAQAAINELDSEKVAAAASSVDSEIMLYSGTSGRASKRATGTGFAYITSGTLGTANPSLTTDVTGVLPIASGGTNSSTALSGSSIAISNGSAIVQGAAGTSTTLLHGNASGAPTYSAASLTSDVTGVLPLANGGTNKNETAAAGAVVYSDADSYEKTAVGSSGQFLKSNGTSAPSFAAVDLASGSVTGVLPLANGGSNNNLTAVSGGIAYSDASKVNLSSAGTSGQELQSNGTNAPTWVNKSISGKAQNVTAVTLEELQVPNNLLTSTATGKYLHETGNKNILANPSFEHSTAGSGWSTSVTGTATATITSGTNTTYELGIKKGVLSCAGGASGGTCLFYQDQNTTTALPGAAWAYLTPSNPSATEFYSRVNAANDKTITTQSTIQTPYKIPFSLGTTSTGLAVKITVPASVTYTSDIDDAFLGAVDLKQDVDQSRIAGESYWAGTTSATCTRTSATIGALTCNAALPSPTIVTSSMGTWGTTDNDLLRQTITDLPAGKYKAKFQVPTISAAASNSAMAINDGTTTCEAVRANDGSAANLNQTVECTFIYTSSGTRTFELYVASAASTITVSNNSTAPRVSTKFILEYFGSGQIYSASCGANCVDEFPFSVSSTGVVSGDDLDIINANCTNATPSVCTFNSGKFTVAPECDAHDNGSSGFMCSAYGETTSGFNITCTDSTGASSAAISKAVTCSKKGADFTATRTIVGSFNELMTTPNVSKPKTCYYSFGGASATLASPTECTTGTCVEVYDSCGTGTPPTWASTAVYNNMTFASGTFSNSSPIDCKCKAYDTSAGSPRKCENYFDTSDQSWASNASGGAVLNLYGTTTAGAENTVYIQLECSGAAP